MTEHTPYKPIGPRVRELRQKKGWSLTKLANEAGISRSYLAQIEYGESTPTQEKIQQLANALGVLQSDLLGENSQEIEIPESLRAFATEMGLESASKEIQMLSQIEYRGKRPSTIEEWKVIYSVIRGLLDERPYE
ncbi:MAG: helix-turn-helix transcriptional regulator [Anaerolineae bacterium]|nr:helix-turn-helix transcriptional regulator [Anaerolineae bacterium]